MKVMIKKREKMKLKRRKLKKIEKNQSFPLL